MRITVLASGSRGNATLVEGGGARLLVDAGLAPRTARRRLVAALGAAPDRVDAILVTHGHGDHCRYAAELSRSFDAPVYVTRETAAERRLVAEVFEAGEALAFGGLGVRTVPVPHDSPQIALVLEDGDGRVGLATDLGVVPDRLALALEGCDTLLLEANHDPGLLARGPYPADIKARIASPVGHLSNVQAAELLARLAPSLRTVVLMHLSQTNNQPGLALAAAARALEGRGARLLAARQGGTLAVEPGRAGQLALDLAPASGGPQRTKGL